MRKWMVGLLVIVMVLGTLAFIGCGGEKKTTEPYEQRQATEDILEGKKSTTPPETPTTQPPPAPAPSTTPTAVSRIQQVIADFDNALLSNASYETWAALSNTTMEITNACPQEEKSAFNAILLLGLAAENMKDVTNPAGPSPEAEGISPEVLESEAREMLQNAKDGMASY